MFFNNIILSVLLRDTNNYLHYYSYRIVFFFLIVAIFNRWIVCFFSFRFYGYFIMIIIRIRFVFIRINTAQLSRRPFTVSSVSQLTFMVFCFSSVSYRFPRVHLFPRLRDYFILFSIFCVFFFSDGSSITTPASITTAGMYANVCDMSLFNEGKFPDFG